MPTFNTQAEADVFLKQNPGYQIRNTQPRNADKGFLGNLVGSFVDPFARLTGKALETANAVGSNQLGDFLSQNEKYQNKFLTNADAEAFKNNAFLETIKDIAGVGANFVPVGALGKGVMGLAKAGAISGGLSSFSNQKSPDLNQTLTDGVVGGLLGGGLGLGGKALSSILSPKVTEGLTNVAQDIKGQNLGIKYKKDISPNGLDQDVRNAVTQLEEAGKAVNPFNLDELTRQNSKDFRGLLADKYSNVKAEFGANNINSRIDDFTKEIKNNVSSISNKKLNVGAIENRLSTDPLYAELNDGISSIKSQLDEMNSTGFNQELGQVKKAIGNKKDWVNGADNLSTELGDKIRGQGLGQGTDSFDEISNFLDSRDKMKSSLSKAYEDAHSQLLKTDSAYAQKFGATLPEAPSFLSDTDKTFANFKDYLTNNSGLGAIEFANSKALNNKARDLVTSLEKTQGNPTELFNLTSKLTVPKKLGKDAILSKEDILKEGMRDYARGFLEKNVPEASAYFQKQAPLHQMLPDARLSLNNANSVSLPVAGTFDIPGAGAFKRGAKSAVGSLIENTAKGGKNLAELLGRNKVSSSLLANGAIRGLGLGRQDMADPNQATTPMPMNEAPSDVPETTGLDENERQAFMSLTTPVKQGGKGLSPSEASKYMELAYGSKMGAGKPLSAVTVKQNAQVKSGLRSLDGISQVLSKDPSVLQKSALPEFMQDENTKQFKNYIDTAAENYGRIQSGGAINKDEEVRFKSQISSIFASPASQQQKLELLRQQFQDTLNQ